MFRLLISRRLLLLAAFFPGLLGPANAQPDQAPPGEKPRHPQIRIVCVTSLDENQELILASRDEKGAWLEHGAFKLRSSQITDWLKVRVGELHLALRDAGELKSLAKFTCPEGAGSLIVVLLPDPVKKTYNADVVDPSKLKFVKGSMLLVNYSSLPGAVVLGSLKTQVKSGERKVVKPVPEANGMYRMLAAYAGKDGNLIPCYDRYVSNNKDAREIMFLLPDPTLGLRVFSLSEFGPFE